MRCDICGEPLRHGDEYYDFDGTIVCKECIEDYLYDHCETNEEPDEEPDDDPRYEPEYYER